MQPLIILGLIVLYCWDHALMASASAAGQWRIYVAPLFMLIGPGLLAATAWATLRVPALRPAHPRQVARLALFCWFLGGAALIGILQWGSIVRIDFQFGSLPPVDDLLIAAPLVASLVLCWMLEYRLAQSWAAERVHWTPTERRMRRHYVWMKAQLYLVPALIPFAAVLSTQTLSAWLVRWTGSPGLEPWVAIACLGGILAAAPRLITLSWRTRSLRGDSEFQSLVDIADASGVCFRDIRAWQTERQMSNALVLGFVPGFRNLILTDRLLDLLSERELSLVIKHEVAHVRLGHFLARACFVVMPLLAVSIAQALVGWWEVEESARGGSTASDFAWVWVLATLAYAVYAFVVMTWASRRMEFQADLFACMGGGSYPRAPIDAAAAETLGQTLIKLAIDSEEELTTAGWLHPSIAQRVELLRLAAAQPGISAAFERKFRRQKILLTAAVCGVAIVIALA